MYPESHGVVGNTFWDPALQSEFYYTDPDRSLEPKWWGGEPFWVTAELQGLRAAVHMWPGSEAHIHDMDPTFLDKYNGKELLPKKVARILEFIDKPGLENPDVKQQSRPQLIAAYVPNVDAMGHLYGPNSTEIRATISEVDEMLDQIFQGLEQRNLTDIVNVIIVSDHGMATTDVARMIQIEDLVDRTKIEHLDGWPLVGIRPKKPEDLPLLYEQAVNNTKGNQNDEVYLKDKDMPERYHFSNNDRIAPLWIIPKTGWAIVEKAEFDIQDAKINNISYHPRGLHGYDHEHPLMRAIFVARGPAFPHQPHSKVEAFQNVNVYNILCDSIGMEPVPNNGTLRLPFKVVGLHDEDTSIEQPEDPVLTSTIDKAATGMMSILPATTTSSTSSASQPTTSTDKSTTSATTEDNPKRPTRPAQPESSQKPEESGKEETPEDADKPDNPDEGNSGSWWDSLKDTVDWAKNKFNDFVDQITGAGG